MKYREKGKNPAKTSLLGFGCMRFPTNEDGTINRVETMKMLDYAYEKGVTYYDTAYFYHNKESEVVVGEWVLTKPRHTFCLTTKNPVWMCKDIQDFDRYLDEQLSNLNTSYLDFYLLHALSKDRWENIKKMNLLDHLKDVIASGKVRRIGFSFHDDYELFDEIIHAYDWDFCQIQFNYMDTEYQAGLKGYEVAKSLNIPVIVMEPIRGGQLANVPTEIKQQFQAIHPDWSDASWALRWVANHDNVMTVLSGMSTKEQVIDNLKTMSEAEELTQQELNTIEQARKLFAARTQVSCTGCRYCMPCPFGVDIPANFRYWNTAHIYDDAENQVKSYKMLEETARASHCQKCGACKIECPQHINIPDELDRVATEFEAECVHN